MELNEFYLYPAFSKQKLKSIIQDLKKINENLISVDAELCFYVDFVSEDEKQSFDFEKIVWFLQRHVDASVTECSRTTFYESRPVSIVLEFGPRLNFTTPFATNALAAFRTAGLFGVKRIERSVRYFLNFSAVPNNETVNQLSAMLHDRMTECRYFTPLKNFNLDIQPAAHFEIDVLGAGKQAIIEANKTYGLALDLQDIDLYYDIFVNKAKRNPTNVELFDLAQSNSEHSRHWFFKGKLIVDDQETELSLFDMVIDTQRCSNDNNVIKFSDNSSGIVGDKVLALKSSNPLVSSPFELATSLKHIIYTAETHNFPTGVCPFPGAATGTGGRIRDVQAAGRGGHVIAGICGYSFGNLHLNDFLQPWEDLDWVYPSNFAKPVEICVQASNGASDYGNKFGEPVICGFARSFGQSAKFSKNGEIRTERIEYVKPIMFSGGIGTIDGSMLSKMVPEKDMLVVKLGGPVYRIGVGGGSASSVEVQGEKHRNENLDFGAVQRGDAEMEQKLNRLIRACLELENRNPIQSIHDQGAGGNGNVLKEIVEGAGAVIHCDKFELGDPTLNVLELWGAEYQESNAVLIKPEDKENMQIIARRERCPVSFVGSVTGDNKIVLVDFKRNNLNETVKHHPVDLNLEWVLGKMPRKTFNLVSDSSTTLAFDIPNFSEALERVLRLPSVASKRYLTNKVDRSVTGLIAQQQCVGPLHTPLADVAVTALSYFDKIGSAVAVGEQPIKMLINPEAGARLTVGEALTNLVFAPITNLKDVKCSANWMWPAKLPGEGARLLNACKAMCKVMSELGIAVDGGKDSLSMAARVDDEIVKSPGTLVISAYAQCTDITKVVTPDFKCPNNNKGYLFYIYFGGISRNSTGLAGSAFAQCYSGLGISRDLPDLIDSQSFVTGFNLLQDLIKDGIIQAGHDISDGGLISCIMEMAFAGNCGLDFNFPCKEEPVSLFFGEHLGVVIEVDSADVTVVESRLKNSRLYWKSVGHSVPVYGPDAKLKICVDNEILIENFMVYFRNIWEETSYHLERLQCNPVCVEQEKNFLQHYKLPPYKFLEQNIGIDKILDDKWKPKIGIVREEGSNGDREMAAAFIEAGFETWDVCMQDFLNGGITVDRFDGLAFVGGFSYADVFGAAKGWASAIEFHDKLKHQFDWFKRNESKFSFGVCNGCQLLALLGWVGQITEDEESKNTVSLDSNISERFESRFSCVKISESPAVMFKNMAGSVLGVWVAHGEGRFVFNETSRASSIIEQNLSPLMYVDQDCSPTEIYPLNPNGSPRGIAGLCSPDGRHLAIMPHPERCFLQWQWPYWPKNDNSKETRYSPWFQMFKNAYDFCVISNS